MNLNEIMRIEKSAFEYSEFGALESVEIGDKVFFPASECAKVLGYHNPRKAIIDHCENTIRLTVPHSLIELVRNDLEQYVQGLELSEEQLQNLLMEQYSKDTKSDRTAIEKELHSAKTRIAELEMLQSKLYEELLLSQLPRETLIELSQKYRTEKTALEQKRHELQSELDRLTAKAEDIHNWLCVVREYMSGTVLDRELLHRLIKVIRVGETTVVDGQKQREVEIVYRF